MTKKSARRLSLLCGAALVPTLMSAHRASAVLLVADGFDYTPTGTNALAAKPDTDFPSNPATWALTGAAGSGPNIIAGSLTYPATGSAPVLTGANSAQVTTTAGADRIQLATPSSSGTFTDTLTPNTTLYYSLTMQVTSETALTTSGSFIAGFNNAVGTNGTALSSAYGDLCIRKNGTSYQLGVAQTQAPTTDRIFGSTNYGASDTLFIVVAYSLGTGTGTDTSNLYVFDGTTNDAVPATVPSTPTVSSPWGADVASGGIESFFLRDNASSATATVDNVLVGTSWGDVVPEPASISLLALAGLASLGRRRKLCS